MPVPVTTEEALSWQKEIARRMDQQLRIHVPDGGKIAGGDANNRAAYLRNLLDYRNECAFGARMRPTTLDDYRAAVSA